MPFTRYSLEGKLEAEKQRAAAARRRRASAATDIAAVTDLENDVPIVFNEDDDAERKKRRPAIPTPKKNKIEVSREREKTDVPASNSTFSARVFPARIKPFTDTPRCLPMRPKA